jgi:cytochrome c553
MIGRALALLLLMSGLLLPGFSPASDAENGIESAGDEAVDFDRQVLPILAHYCLPCHGNDGEARKKDLRLDDQDSATTLRDLNIPAISPGHPENSLALLRINDDDDPMPPDGRERPSVEEVEILTRWVEQGASYTKHWSWRPLEAPELPELVDEDWARDPLDLFIGSGLDSLGLKPAPDADDRTWLRRVTFDLTGLPATPEEIEAFLADRSVEAREGVVDRLLQSSAHAEHFARHWLDLMRFAETHGHEFDYPIHEAWKYRDYVIRAIASDVPIDRFVTEHIAGDLLEDPRIHPRDGTNDSLPATSWFWLSQGTHGPVDVLKDTHDRVDNQIDVLSRAFLGATVSCARCHDHKFDAITQADWTGLSSIIRSTRRVLRPQDPGGKISSKIDEMAPVREKLTAVTRQGMELQHQLPLVQLARAARGLQGSAGIGEPGELDAAPDVVVADFEQGWGPWTVEGNAFGDQPHHRDDLVNEQAVEAVGDHIACSQDHRPAPDGPAGDVLKGKLTSPPFELQRDYLVFLVGGGQHAGKTCVNLLVDGEQVFSEVGRNNTRMHEARWDVGRWRGQEAIIEVVDDHDGGWGHITCDHFRLTDEPAAGMASRGQIERVARKAGLDGNQLREWVRLWPQLVRPGVANGPLRDGDLLLTDFSQADALDDWSIVGEAFEVLSAGDVVLIGRPRIIDTSCAHSAVRGRSLVGSLLSRNFTIEHRYLHLRVQGESARVRICIEGYWIDQHNALLFENFRQNVNSPEQWRHLQMDLTRYQGKNAHVEIHDEGRGWIAVDRVWLSAEGVQQGIGVDWTVLDDEATDSAKLLADPVRAEALLAAGLVDSARYGDAWNAAVVSTVEQLRQLDESVPQPNLVLSAADAPRGFDVHLSIRGDPHKPGDLIERRALENLGGAETPQRYRNGSGRRELANWITSSDNPLFWRTQANRLWARVMGRGVAATSDDLGAMGIPPDNRALLDHLAVRLRDHPSRRSLLKDIVLSRSYQMASHHPDPRAQQVDATNAHWHRSHQKRLNAEAIRDSILSVSGRLDRKVGGTSVPVHLTDFLTGRGRPGGSGPVDGHGRRSIYIKVCRNFLPAFLTAFDFPIPATTVGDRLVTNVPAQALALMNDPFVHEQARLWGERVMKSAEDEGLLVALDRMWQQAFARPPSGEEIAMARSFVEGKGGEGWADLAHALIQTKEFRFIP